MSSRKAACDPCRKAKLACGHERPVCVRCVQRQKDNTCIYRHAPFTRSAPKRPGQSNITSSKFRSVSVSPTRRRNREWDSSPSGSADAGSFEPSIDQNRYPNPGFLGPSSHASIFKQIPSEHRSGQDSTHPESLIPSSLNAYPYAKEGAEIIREILEHTELEALARLVRFWRAKGVNLAVAAPFVDLCADSSNYSSIVRFEGAEWHMELSARLLENTVRKLEHNAEMTCAAYAAQFLGNDTRWETLGIFVCACIQATRDIQFFPLLYKTSSQRQNLQRLLTRLNDCALETCLSADCLNDLQLALQYENFIVHSFVDGDQSYRYWRALGDVITSIFAMGHHEDLESRSESPPFLTQLRKTIFAKTYSADKNVALFLGRPLRMSKRFCYFQVPWCPTSHESFQRIDAHHGIWEQESMICYEAGAIWSALCASVKEDILELMFSRESPPSAEKVSALQYTVDTQWEALPVKFRLARDLKNASYNPFERDFLVSTRLNHLHTSFLIHCLSSSQVGEPSTKIIELTQEMLHLVVQCMLLRDELANSETGLDWKIMHYGLPSAGVLLLGMLRHQTRAHVPQISRGQIFRDLIILVAEVESGTVVRAEEPNYELLSQAIQTIKKFIDGNFEGGHEIRDFEEAVALDSNDWLEQWNYDGFDFDIDFWQELGDHAPLYNADPIPTH